MTNPTISGIAGGVGTTVLTTILGGTEYASTIDADIVVARNDYRCAKALVNAIAGGRISNALIVLYIDPARALDQADFDYCVAGSNCRIVAIPLNPAIGRADDAGLLDVGSRATDALRNEILSALAVSV